MEFNTIEKIQQQLNQIRCCDRKKIIAHLIDLKKAHEQSEPIYEKINALLELSHQKVTDKKIQLPPIEYPDLPVSDKLPELKEAIMNNQVIIVAGETGSGKSTQLPKICLDIGLGARGFIGHTQPRRLAARSVANRLAEELKTTVGEKVGFKIRFSDHTNDNTFIKLMTDGILLAEIQKDKFLSQYEAIIIDEAHERSLNIDFLLGYLKQLLPKRPDLKVIITSATIDHTRFSKHFNHAPIIEVSGRTYPVEQRYECYEEYDENISQPEKILTAVEELMTEGQGDILVFLATEREIFETLDSLNKANLKHTEVLPLFSRLSQSDQNKIFNTQSFRKVILSTNVAETSLTVPGIKYVIDTGFVRISRYNYRTKVQRLPIEPISQASANQRAGRCGRTSPGICIRLYAKDDFDGRPAFTDPEILRTSLAAVILQMELLNIGHIQDFPFIEPPEHKFIEDGYKQLYELGAISEQRTVTPIGKHIAQFQVDPKFARMIIEAQKWHCVDELLIITSFLSVQDPRERPTQFQQKSDQAHQEHKDKTSDFLSILNLWRLYQEKVTALTNNQFRKFCRDKFLAYMRLREWNDIYQQLKTSAKLTQNNTPSEPASYDQIHQSILPGLLNNIGFNYDAKEYMGARGLKFFIFPGSSQFKPTPKWIMASELVETTKLYARNVARIQPEWVEKCAAHLIKRTYFEPHWSKKHRNVMAFEKVTLYGLEIVAKRLISYSQIDPKLSRELFIRGALVNGDINTQVKFFHANLALLDEVDDLENKARSRDILVDDETLFNYYDQVIDHAVVNQVTFEQWVKKLDKEQLDKLFFEKSDLMRHDAANITENLFPPSFQHDHLQLPLDYHFEPGTQKDGITITIPQIVLHQIKPMTLEWLVPGMLKEKIIALIRALPKNIRKYCVPVPQYADAIMESIQYDPNQNLKSLLVKELIRITGIVFDETVWNDCELEAHLVMNIKIIDPAGKILKTGRNLFALQQQIKPQKNLLAHQKTQSKIYIDWDFPDLKREEIINQYGIQVTVYPCLKTVENGVELSQENTLTKAEHEHQKAILTLLARRFSASFKNLRKQVNQFDKISMLASTLYTKSSWEQDFIQAVLIKSFPLPQTRIVQKDVFEKLIEDHASNLSNHIQEISKTLFNIFTGFYQLKKNLKRKSIPLDLLNVYQSIGDNLETIIYEGFLAQTPIHWLERIPYYIQASEARLLKAPRKTLEDRKYRLEIENLNSKLSAKMTSQQLIKEHQDVQEISWLMQELWISWYTQEIKTIQPVSVKRIEKLISSL